MGESDDGTKKVRIANPRKRDEEGIKI